MSTVAGAIRAHHHELAARLTAEAAAVTEPRSDADLATFTTFLKEQLLAHAQGEEQVLYPLLNPIIREHGMPTATMSVDHEFIAGYVRQIEETVTMLRTASAAERAPLRQRLRTLVIQLDGLFQMHIAKEERVYLPLFEAHLAEPDQRRALDQMHEAPIPAEAPSAESDAVKTLDVRDIPPARRHPMIFGFFENLKPGASFILVNDHDPKPLYYQLKIEHAGQLAWEYLEQGPVTWRVRVGKTA